jgi:hypothetical protein
MANLLPMGMCLIFKFLLAFPHLDHVPVMVPIVEALKPLILLPLLLLLPLLAIIIICLNNNIRRQLLAISCSSYHYGSVLFL